MESVVVNQLPELTPTELGELPVNKIRPGNLLVPFGTKWRRLEKITVAVAVINGCVQAGRWQPVSQEDFEAIIVQDLYFRQFPKRCHKGLEALIKKGDLILIEYQGKQYLVPTRSLVRGVFNSSPFMQATRPQVATH